MGKNQISIYTLCQTLSLLKKQSSEMMSHQWILKAGMYFFPDSFQVADCIPSLAVIQGKHSVLYPSTSAFA